MGKDRISELPEELLLQRLSLLPPKTVITTSILSKRWLSLWKLVPKLEFDSDNYQEDIAKFLENVGKFLLSHKAPVLESLRLRVTDKTEETRCVINVGVWVGIAVVRHVRKLVLDLFLFKSSVRFPTSVLFSDTLETLQLKYSVLVDVPSRIYVKSLRTLHLYHVSYKDGESIHNLISGCPNLEDFLIQGGTCKVVLTLVIEAPSLKRLWIHGQIGGRKTMINAPCLEYLEMKGFSHGECCLIENAPVLVKATISNVSYIVNENILGSLKSAKRLSLNLSPLEIKCPTGAIFHQLVYLEMYTREAEWWNLLTIMLDSSPKLQVLKLIDVRLRSDGCLSLFWGLKYEGLIVIHILPCLFLTSMIRMLAKMMWTLAGDGMGQSTFLNVLSSCLETFVWNRIRYGCEREEEEKEVAKYILKNARLLKKATFSTTIPIESKELNKLEERRKMLLNELSRVKASNSYQLVFDGESI
ncbi:PREDICTED: F-box/FBD/LRR-repeat protein At3g52680-like [Camelina sativa]|uniref:F-box/FBD/LRR-repeat protein At3g52680-like n=1 Tax=Camelina sativa TaxID=90675 RepID=A0ABM1RL27_CAMSA|nr:PREDICTED: F-box/FBD/LRR-repeat protein At3g52680-like [Camelina sativa]